MVPFTEADQGPGGLGGWVAWEMAGKTPFSGVRAKEFGDVVFMDHCEIKHMTKKHQLFLVLDGATSLLWGSTQQEGTEPITQDLFREWMHIHSCKPKWVVADMAFFTPSWMTFWKTHGVKTMPTGRATPWPNRAETAVRLFKRQYEKLLMDASVHPALNKVTLRDLIRECCWTCVLCVNSSALSLSRTCLSVCSWCLRVASSSRVFVVVVR